MASPFNIFRQNQKILMVALVGLAMVSFIAFGDTMDPSSVLPVLAALLGALALWLLSGKSGNEGLAIAAVGGVLGLVVGLVGPRFFNSDSVATTSAGSVSNRDLMTLAEDQRRADNLVAAALIAGGVDPSQIRGGYFGFTDPDQPGNPGAGLMIRYLMGQEADRLGIQVSNEAVREFLSEASKGKFSEDDFRKLRSRLRVGADDLIAALRGELRAQQAYLILSPKIGSVPPELPRMEGLPPQQQELFWRLQLSQVPPAGVTPLRLWEDFEKLQEEAKITAVAVPADAFVAQVEEPSSAVLNPFFDQFKNSPPVDGRPGFRVPPKVQLAYFAVGPDSVRKTLSPVTDAEVKDYYERNKDDYRLFDLDTPAGGETPGGETPAAPVEAPKPADSAASETPAEAKPAETKPEGDSTSALTADESFVSFQDGTAAPAEASKPSEATKSPEAAKPAAEPASEPTAAPSFPAPGDASPPKTEAAPRYRALDDDLKARIRETLTRQRTAAALDEVTQTALDETFKIADEEAAAVLPPEDQNDPKAVAAFEKQRTAAVKAAVEKMKTYAKSKGYPFTATTMVSADDLRSGEDYPIGLAVRWVPGRSPFQRGAETVPDMVFGTDQLLVAAAAEEPATGVRYVFVKTADEPEHVPSLEDKGVREAVVAAWKKTQARKLAADRAKELADAARAAKQDLGAYVAAQKPTITGKKGGQELTAREVGPFSWYRQSSAPALGLSIRQISLGSVPQLEPVGDDFMRTVFETLKPGEVGTSASADGSVAYVVEVDSKTPDKSEGYEPIRRQFLAERSEYLYPHGNEVGMAMRREAEQEWIRNLKAKYAVQWTAMPQPAGPPAAF